MQVARSEPDRYTLLINASNHTITPAIYKNFSFDAVNDFASVALFSTVPNVLLVSPDKSYKTVQDLVAKAKTQELTFSSSGISSASHWQPSDFASAPSSKRPTFPSAAAWSC